MIDYYEIDSWGITKCAIVHMPSVIHIYKTIIMKNEFTFFNSEIE